MQHAYFESSNPRLAGRCACGRTEDEHPPPAFEPRDIEYERDITIEAASTVVDPSGLIEFAETRAGQDHGYGHPGMVRTGVDWLREGRCEGADWRNYACFWLKANPGHPKAQDIFLALRHIAYAYDLFTREAEDE